MEPLRLSSLPVELVTMIAEEALPSGLLALCLTCRDLKTVATRLLYRDIWLREIEYYDDRGSSIESVRLLQLVETLLLKPDLARMIESFRCGLVPAYNWHPYRAPWIPQDSAKLKLEEFLRGTPEAGNMIIKWQKLLDRSFHVEQTLPFVLLHMPNLRALELHSTNARIWQSIREIVDISLSAGPSSPAKGWLSQLELLCMRDAADQPGDRNYTDPPRTILAFSKLPSFKHLRIHIKGYTADILRPPNVVAWEKQDLSRMRSLEIHTSFCLRSGQELHSFYRACSGLRVLRYHPQEDLRSLWLAPTQHGVPYEEHWHEPYMFNGLPHPDIKVLSVRKQFGDPLTVPLDLSGFTSVERLEVGLLFIFHWQKELWSDSIVPVRSLYGPEATQEDLMAAENRLVEVLPGSLKDVVFTGCGDVSAARYLNRALLVMLRQKEEKFPRLRSIDCWRDDYAPGADQTTDAYLDALGEAFAFARGIGVAVKAIGRTKYPWGSTDEMWDQKEHESHSPLALRNRLDQLNRLCSKYDATGNFW